MTGRDDSFIGRWSRRKRAVDEEDAARVQPDAAPEPVPDPIADPEPATLTEDELAALPRIEDLTQGSDIKMFLRAGVPRALRSAALRKVWMLTPAIRDYKNPAVDYAWDYNTPGGVPGDGVAPTPERAAQMLRDLFAPRTPETAVAGDDASAPVPDASAEHHGPASEAVVAADETASTPEDRPAPRPRHGGALPS